MTPASDLVATVTSRIAEIRANPDREDIEVRIAAQDAHIARMQRDVAIDRAHSLSVVGERFTNRTFATFERTRENSKALDTALQVAADPNRGAAFSGPPGVGKTHLAGAIAHDVVERGFATVVDTVSAILRRIRLTWDVGVKLNEAEVVERLTSAPVLVLDDLGKEYLTPWTAATLWDVVNARYERNRPLVVTSNSSLSELLARYSRPVKDVDPETLPAMMDRVIEMTGGPTGWVSLTGASRRWESV